MLGSWGGGGGGGGGAAGGGGLGNRFTLCRVFSVAFGRADTNLLYAYNMLNGN